MKRFRTGKSSTVLKSSGTSVKSSTVQDEDSETRSKGQTSEVVGEERSSAPSKQLVQWGKESQNLKKTQT